MYVRWLIVFTLLTVGSLAAECVEKDSLESGTRYWDCGDSEVKIRDRAGAAEILLRLESAFDRQEYIGERVEIGQAIEIQGLERFSGGIRTVLLVRGARSDDGFVWEIRHSDYTDGHQRNHQITFDGVELREAFLEGEAGSISSLSNQRFSVVGAVTRDEPEAVYCQFGLCAP